MKSVSAPSSEDVPIWIHLVMGSLTIIASVLVTRYLYKYFRMAMDSDQLEQRELENDLESNNSVSIPSSTPPPADGGTIVYPSSPQPSRQRIVTL